MTTQTDYAEGDTIEYETWGGEIRRVIVDYKSDDIKNGRPGFDGALEGATALTQLGGVWGYDDQITRVVRKAAR